MKDRTKYILWVEDEPKHEMIRIRYLNKKLPEGYILKLFKYPREVYKFVTDGNADIAGIVLDLMLPFDEKDEDIFQEKITGFMVGVKLAEILCKKHNYMKIIILTNLTPYTETGKRIKEMAERVECVKAFLQKTEAGLVDFVNKVFEIFKIQKEKV